MMHSSITQKKIVNKVMMHLVITQKMITKLCALTHNAKRMNTKL